MVDKGYRPQGKRLTGFEGFEEYSPKERLKRKNRILTGLRSLYGTAQEIGDTGGNQLLAAAKYLGGGAGDLIDKWEKTVRGVAGATTDVAAKRRHIPGFGYDSPLGPTDFERDVAISTEDFLSGKLTEEEQSIQNRVDIYYPHKASGPQALLSGEYGDAARKAWMETPGAGVDVPIPGRFGQKTDRTFRVGLKGAAELLLDVAVPFGSAGKVAKVTGLTKGKSVVKNVSHEVSSATDVPGAAPDIATVVVPPANNIFGLTDMKVGLTRQEIILNAFTKNIPSSIKQKFTVFSTKDGLGTRLGNEITRIKLGAQSTGVSISAEFDASAKKLFQFDDHGGIPRLQGVDPGLTYNNVATSPTIQDVAARYPKFKEKLTAQEQVFFEDLRRRLAPVSEQLKEMGIELTPRADVIEGGFYVPRGYAKGMQVDGPLVPTGKVRKPNPGFTKKEKYDSMGEGIASGEDYTDLRSTLHMYLSQSGSYVADKWAGKVLKEATDASGNPISRSQAQRLQNMAITGDLIASNQNIRNLTAKIRSQSVRAAEAKGKAKLAAEQAKKRAARAPGEIERTRKMVMREIAEPAMRRTEKAARNIAERTGVVTVKDFTRALKAVETAVENNAWIISRIKDRNKIFKAVTGKLTKEHQEMERLAYQYNDVVNSAERIKINADAIFESGEIGIQAEGRLAKHYENLMKEADKLNLQLERSLKKINNLDERSEKILEDLDIYQDLKPIARLDLKNNRQSAVALKQKEMLEDIADHELMMLQREEARAIRIADTVEARDIKRIQREVKKIDSQATGLDDEAAKALLELQAVRQELVGAKARHFNIKNKYSAARELTEEAPEGYQKLSSNLPGMGEYEFPKAIADALDVQIAKDTSWLGEVGAAAGWINGIHRSLRATWDMSAIGIHGILRSYDSPGLAARSFKWQFGAWVDSGDQLLGAFVGDFNRKVSEAGRLTSEQWTGLGLHMGGEATEFMVGAQKGTGFLRKIPGIEKSNRAFGFLGDRMRLEWADEWLADEIRSGKTLDELIESGRIREIAEGANRATGYTSGSSGGAVGEMLLFAPKFLRARIDNIVNTAKSMQDPLGVVEAVPLAGKTLRRGLTKAKVTRDIPMEQRLARRSVLRFIAGAALLTEGINRAQGKETDWRFFIPDSITGKPHINPQFGAINIFGRDHFLLGTYHSLLRLMAITGLGFDTAVRGLDPVEGAEQVRDGFRGMSSGVVQMTWDFVTGSDMMGENARADWMPGDSDALGIAGHIMESFIPIPAEEAPDAWEKVREGDTVGAVANMGVEIIGMKSTPPSYSDIVRKITAEKREQGIPSPSAFGDHVGWDPENLTKAERNALKNEPELKDYSKKFEARSKDELGQKFEDHNLEMEKLDNSFLTAIATKKFNRMEYRYAIQDLMGKRADENSRFHNLNKDMLDEIDREYEKDSIDYFAARYWGIELDTEWEYNPDFKKREMQREQVIRDAIKVFGEDKEAEIREYIIEPSRPGSPTYRAERFTDARVRDIVAEYEEDMDTLRFYFEIGDSLAKDQGFEYEWEKRKRMGLSGWEDVRRDIEGIDPVSGVKKITSDGKLSDAFKGIDPETGRPSTDPFTAVDENGVLKVPNYALYEKTKLIDKQVTLVREQIRDGTVDSLSPEDREQFNQLFNAPPDIPLWVIEAKLVKLGYPLSILDLPFHLLLQKRFARRLATGQTVEGISPSEIQSLIDEMQTNPGLREELIKGLSMPGN